MQELQDKLEHRAFHDPLTDLANRMLFPDRVDDALARDPETVSVIFVDINDFKNVNDTLGHAAGDELLVAIARRLSDCVRPADTLARMGGDEFARASPPEPPRTPLPTTDPQRRRRHVPGQAGRRAHLPAVRVRHGGSRTGPPPLRAIRVSGGVGRRSRPCRVRSGGIPSAARAVSSAGQSACLTSRRSLVRAQYRPLAKVLETEPF